MNTFNRINIGDLVLEKSWSPKIDTVVDYASDGSVITYEKDRLWENYLLRGGESWGWLSSTVIEQLSTCSSEKGGIFSLIYNGITHIMRFRTEESDCIKAVPVNPHNPLSDYNNIEIKLMEV